MKQAGVINFPTYLKTFLAVIEKVDLDLDFHVSAILHNYMLMTLIVLR